MSMTRINEQHLPWTHSIGKIALPHMQTLSNNLPKMLGAVLCSGDGFNICSIGLNNMDVGKMASLTSSLFSMSNAVATTIADNVDKISADGKKEALLTIDSCQVAIVEVAHPRSGNLVLMVAVDSTLTGIIFVAIRKLVEQLEAEFQD